MASKKSNGVFDSNLAVAFLWPFKTIFWLLVIFLSLGILHILIVIFFSIYVWDQPIQSSELLLSNELKQIVGLSDVGTARLSLMTEFTQRWTYWLFFQATNIHNSVYAYLHEINHVNEIDNMFLRLVVGNNIDTIYVLMNTIQVFGIRIGFLIASLPLFILVYIAATIDGLSERYIRRACAGRESSDLFKLGRITKLGLFASGITVYFCVPLNISPYLFIITLLIIMAIATRIQWQFYKKYF